MAKATCISTTNPSRMARNAREVVHLGKRIIFEMNANGGDFPDEKSFIIDRRAHLRDRVIYAPVRTLADVLAKAAVVLDCAEHPATPEAILAADILAINGIRAEMPI